MKKLALVLAVVMVFALFAGCGNNNQPAATDKPTATAGTSTETPTPDSEETTEPVEEGPYHFAAGKFEKDANGLPTAKYTYELPLTTSDETLTFWTCCYTPGYITTDYAESPFPIEVENQTGVNIEYMVVSADIRSENFSVLVASDELPDISSQASSFYSGIFKDAVTTDEYFVNLYDYRDYMPNYMYEVAKSPDDSKLQNTVYLDDTTIGSFITMRDKTYRQNCQYVRSDWLDIVGWTRDDIVTWDDTYELLCLFQSQIETAAHPTILYPTLESAGFHYVCFDTLAYVNPYGLSVQVTDGKVWVVNTTENDKNLMTELNKWFNQGLFNPNWQTFSMMDDSFRSDWVGDSYGYIALATSDCSTEKGVLDSEDAAWMPLTDPVLYEGQVMHVGGETSRAYYGSAAISAKCKNIELAITWCDWRYSDEGADLMSWGVEGTAWDYDAEGNRKVSDYICKNADYNMTMLMLIYCMNTLCDPGLDLNYVHYAYDGGDEVIAAYDYLRETRSYDAAYEWPSGIILTADQSSEIYSYMGDVQTYINENYLQFVDGSKPLSDWDSYVGGLSTVGLNEILAVYQEAYDQYMAG